jgi:trk system potassium uptake protein TrkH
MWQLVFMVNGYLIGILGFFMLIAASYDMYITSNNWSYFLTSGIVSLFIGISLFLSNRCEVKSISMRQGYLLTTLSWSMFAVLGALPFYISGSTEHFYDAVFEAMSGITATGATIFKDVESLPDAILLWRSLLNAMGGIGIIIFAVALLPFLGIGGMQIFQRENSDINDKFMPKFHYIAKRIIIVYLFFGTACTVCLHSAGMGWFDAINHAMATTATAGFSTKNASIAFFDSIEIELIISLFMITSSLPMTFYIVLLNNRFRSSIRTEQIYTFLKILAVYIAGMSVWLIYNGVYTNIWTALRYASFNIVSTVTTTGFASADFLKWGAISGSVFLFFSLTGGCTGSTSGSVKIFRWQVIWAYLKQSLILATDPNRVVPVKIKNHVVDNSVISSVIIFVGLFFSTILILTVLLAVSGLDFDTSLSSVIACITNTGPGTTDLIGPFGNYASFTIFEKNVLTAAMLLGRLEILTVWVVFTKNFWRK